MMRLDLAFACTVCLLLVSQVEGQGAWYWGRSTFYGDETDPVKLSMGSCMYGYLDPNKCTGRDIGALSDQHPEFNWADKSCGRCFEVKCVNDKFKDGNGETLDRLSSCYDTKSSVVVQITDMCPCHYPNNYASNKRWCCGDMAHMDLSVWAFEKLAPRSLGVIRTMYRRVPCDYQPKFRAYAPGAVTAPNEWMPWGWKDKRPCPNSNRPTSNRRPPVNRRPGSSGAKKTKANMRVTTWSFDSWSSRGIGGANAAICGSMYGFGGVNLAGNFRGRKAVEFWVRKEGGNVPDVWVKLGGQGCVPRSIYSLKSSGEQNGYRKYYLSISSFKCKSTPTKVLLQYRQQWGKQTLCVDGPVLH